MYRPAHRSGKQTTANVFLCRHVRDPNNNKCINHNMHVTAVLHSRARPQTTTVHTDGGRRSSCQHAWHAVLTQVCGSAADGVAQCRDRAPTTDHMQNAMASTLSGRICRMQQSSSNTTLTTQHAMQAAVTPPKATAVDKTSQKGLSYCADVQELQQEDRSHDTSCEQASALVC